MDGTAVRSGCIRERNKYVKTVMFSILKPFFRLALIMLVVAGIAAMVAGPERVHAMAHQVKAEISDVIDSNIDDPVALRAQLRKLEKEYPERIAQVNSDLGELQMQIRDLEREKSIAQRVVLLARQDAESFHGEFETEPVAYSTASSRYAANAAASRAKARAAQANQVAATYAGRVEDADRDLGYLYQQAERMEEVLAQLESERAQFQAQLIQLERQVDAVARNERLISLMEKRNKTIEEMSRYEAGSLDQIQSRLAGIRNRQEAELQVLSSAQNQMSYEERAKYELESASQSAEAAVLVPQEIVLESCSRF